MGAAGCGRRQFLEVAALAGVGHAGLLADEEKPNRPPVCVYTEHFQSLPIPEVCRLFKQMGVDGLDLTVRPGGHIRPEEVTDRLPVAVQAAADEGLRVMMLTTAITSADGVAERTFAACEAAGIGRVKLGYHGAGEFGSLRRRMGQVRRQLESVVELGAKFGVRPCVHVHSGRRFRRAG